MTDDDWAALISKRDEILSEQLGNILGRLEAVEEKLDRRPCLAPAFGSPCPSPVRLEGLDDAE